MAFPSIKTRKGGGDFKNVPGGSHLAICVQVIDLGMQADEFRGAGKDHGKITNLPKVYLNFEVPGETIERDGKQVPLTIGKEFTNFIGGKSVLSASLESWRGRKFTPEEIEGFELTSIIGQPCILYVEEKTVNDKSRSNIKQIIGMMSDQKASFKANPIKPVAELFAYSPEAHDESVFEKIPEWLQKKIKARLVEGHRKAETESQAQDFDDEIPF